MNLFIEKMDIDSIKTKQLDFTRKSKYLFIINIIKGMGSFMIHDYFRIELKAKIYEYF